MGKITGSGTGELAIAQSLRSFSQAEGGGVNHRQLVAELYAELRPGLYGYLICIGLEPEEADDIIQETFLRMFRHLEAGGKDDNLSGWAYRVAHNLGVNLRKRERRLVSRPFESPDAGCDIVDPGNGPERTFLEKEQLLKLDGAVARLPEQQRQCLHLRAQGMRYREIAAILGTSVSSVAESLERAIVRLSSELYD